MSANYPPPQQPPGGQNPYGQNPYAQQPPVQQPYAAPPQGAPYGAPPQAPWGGFNGAAYPPPAPVAPARDNVALGILVGIVAALVAGALYGALIKGTKHEIGYAALGVGALVGLALGKVGGRNPVLPVLGVPLALLGVYFGQLFGIALLLSGHGVTVTDIFFHHFQMLQDTWKDTMHAKEILFFAFAGLEGFVITKRVAG